MAYRSHCGASYSGRRWRLTQLLGGGRGVTPSSISGAMLRIARSAIWPWSWPGPSSTFPSGSWTPWPCLRRWSSPARGGTSLMRSPLTACARFWSGSRRTCPQGCGRGAETPTCGSGGRPSSARSAARVRPTSASCSTASNPICPTGTSSSERGSDGPCEIWRGPSLETVESYVSRNQGPAQLPVPP